MTKKEPIEEAARELICADRSAINTLISILRANGMGLRDRKEVEK